MGRDAERSSGRSAVNRRSLGGLLVLLALAGCAAEPAEDGAALEEEVAADGTGAAAFDSARATRLGADAYGMRTYVVALLEAGPNRDVDSATAAELQRAHLDNVFRLADEGSLLLQGPFLDDGPLRGFYIFDATTIEQARELTETDPAVQAGWLEMELRPWYGSAALQEVYDIHRRIRQRNP